MNSLNWELIRRDVNGYNWNGIIRYPCSVLSLHETLFRFIGDGVSKRTIVVSTGDKLWFDGRCVLAHRT